MSSSANVKMFVIQSGYYWNIHACGADRFWLHEEPNNRLILNIHQAELHIWIDYNVYISRIRIVNQIDNEVLYDIIKD